ncbi:MAG TPA: glycosyltransferase [Steroidobacteraceae bacterium]
MKFVLFYHSLISDWNHGNAHFLRGVASDLLARGHDVEIYEPADGWSVRNLLEEVGPAAIRGFEQTYPELSSHRYTFECLDVDLALDGADVAIVHEWNEPKLIRRIGECASSIGCHAFFHDTHHRSVTEPAAMAALDLRHYDGVLAFGETVAERYRRNAWADRVWVWHEAADVRRFRPLEAPSREGDVVWIGNWGDEERSAELHEFLIDPVARLGLEGKVYGVRYPRSAIDQLRAAGLAYEGWLPNYRVPEVFSRYACTVHVPRRAYVSTLAGVPTIRIFEALACGIPLISAPWEDTERLFRTGVDYRVARDGAEMKRHLRDVLDDAAMARTLAQNGLRTIRERHTCSHRVDELLAIVAELEAPVGEALSG